MVAYYPETIMEAVSLRKDHPGATIYAGGTDLMVTKKIGEHVIFVTHVEEMRTLTRDENGLTIGAAVPYVEILASHEVPEIIKDVIVDIASPAIRSRGTVAGNICNASPAGDTLPMLHALDAVVCLASAGDDGVVCRQMPIGEFVLGVRRTALQENEVVTAIKIPADALTENNLYAYKKVGARRAEAISKLSFFGRAAFGGERITTFRTAFGSVFIITAVSPEASRLVEGMTKAELAQKREEISEMCLKNVKPIDDQRSNAAYRALAARNLLKDFLDKVTE
ncbi:MAG: FAD binding domain-containing protein [Lachnospiraceae bacterium]|nr:FAD binding domain-containing protein [Lachnospiraceae bacterium]